MKKRGDDMSEKEGAVFTRPIICPVCKEKFIPAPLHIYKTTTHGKLVCSYHCMMNYRKEQERKKRELKRKKKNENI